MTSSQLSAPVIPDPVPPPRLPAPVAALVGVLSMAAGLATGHLAGGFISPTASPFLAVGSSAIDLTPSWLKDFAVRAFGSYDKLILLSGMAVVVGLVGVTAGLLSR
ncbi:MAG: molybdopterin-dependent oxidoreductase, partial [Pseudonocardiaceae bacterium]